MAATRVGFWYATGPGDKDYSAGDPAFSPHTVISDESNFAEHVTVENAAGQQFPVPLSLIETIAAPNGPVHQCQLLCTIVGHCTKLWPVWHVSDCNGLQKLTSHGELGVRGHLEHDFQLTRGTATS